MAGPRGQGALAGVRVTLFRNFLLVVMLELVGNPQVYVYIMPLSHLVNKSQYTCIQFTCQQICKVCSMGPTPNVK